MRSRVKKRPLGSPAPPRQGVWLHSLAPAGYEELSRARVLEQTNNAFGRKVVWCAPAFADKKMYVRNDKELVCFDLAK